jgi:hypothetical protein
MPNRAERRAAERAKNLQQAAQACPNNAENPAPVQEPIEQTFAAAANASAPQPARKPISEAQLNANRANAKLSNGAVTITGRQASSLNHLSHGLTRHNGFFSLLASESIFGFERLLESMLEEHQPTTETEGILVNAMVESHWLANRAQNLADSCFNGAGQVEDQKLFALYLRYHTTHTRAFYKSLNELLKLRAETRKAEIGFEAQKLKQSAATRAVETLELRKEVFEWQKEVAQTKKAQAQTAPATQTDAEPSPQTQKMAA